MLYKFQFGVMEPTGDPRPYELLKVPVFHDSFGIDFAYGVIIQDLHFLKEPKFRHITHLKIGDDAWYRKGQWYPCDAL